MWYNLCIYEISEVRTVPLGILPFLSSLADAVVRERPTTAVILAAGSSERFSGGTGEKKQFFPVGGVPAVVRSAQAFDECPDVKEIIVVTGEEDVERCRGLLEGRISKLAAVVPGGDVRMRSAEAGLEKASPSSRFIAVHDAARCLVTPDAIKKVIAAASRAGAAVAACPATDTVKRSDGYDTVEETLDRDRVWLISTPQVFTANLYRAALYSALKDGASVTDDAMMAERLGFKVKLVDCGRENIKITYPEDAAIAEAILARRAANGEGSKEDAK